MKHCLLLTSLLLFFSCAPGEDDVRKFVEQDVVCQAEDYLICQAIVNYVKEEANEVFTDKLNYYIKNPYHDYSYAERDMFGPFMRLASAYGVINKTFDERRTEFTRLYTRLSDEYTIREEIEQIDSTLSLKDLINESSPYSIKEIADIYFMPNRMNFTEITPELYEKIYRSMLCLGAKTYKYDVVDEIRVKKNEDNKDNKWTVDLVYHSGYCMPLEIDIDNENNLFVSKAPWIPKAAELADCINKDNYAEKLSFEEALNKLYLAHGITDDPQKYKNYDESIKGKYDIEEAEFEFRLIDNYRLFLSDDAECNQGEEPFRTFICKIQSSKSFLKSRISLSKNELQYFDINSIPSFRFCMDLNLSYSGSKIVGYERSGASWKELTKDNASYVYYAGMDIWERLVFKRVDGKWYLKEYWDCETMEDDLL